MHVKAGLRFLGSMVGLGDEVGFESVPRVVNPNTCSNCDKGFVECSCGTHCKTGEHGKCGEFRCPCFCHGVRRS